MHKPFEELFRVYQYEVNEWKLHFQTGNAAAAREALRRACVCQLQLAQTLHKQFRFGVG